MIRRLRQSAATLVTFAATALFLLADVLDPGVGE